MPDVRTTFSRLPGFAVTRLGFSLRILGNIEPVACKVGLVHRSRMVLGRCLGKEILTQFGTGSWQWRQSGTPCHGTTFSGMEQDKHYSSSEAKSRL